MHLLIKFTMLKRQFKMIYLIFEQFRRQKKRKFASMIYVPWWTRHFTIQFMLHLFFTYVLYAGLLIFKVFLLLYNGKSRTIREQYVSICKIIIKTIQKSWIYFIFKINLFSKQIFHFSYRISSLFCFGNQCKPVAIRFN